VKLLIEDHVHRVRSLTTELGQARKRRVSVLAGEVQELERQLASAYADLRDLRRQEAKADAEEVRRQAELKKQAALDEIDAVCVEYGVTLEQLASVHKWTEIVRPRQELMWRLRVKHGWMYKQIGLLLKRDHSTVIHAVKKVQRNVDSDVNPLQERNVSEIKAE
jgi:chromosomal replication initiation ATPase DnaA